MPTIGSFNANNFFLRYNFSNVYPGDELSQRSIVEATEVAAYGYLPKRNYGRYSVSNYIVWDYERRELAYDALLAPDGLLPDILCLQEVENIHAIRILNDRYFGGYYPYSFLVDAYDVRNIDVGVLSRIPISLARSHIEDTNVDGEQLFRSRDCLELEFELPGENLTLFVNHLKSKFVDTRGATPDEILEQRLDGHQKRLKQAEAIVDYIDRRFRGEQSTALYAVVGDLNDTPESPWIEPLISTPRLTNILQKYLGPEDHWTYYWRSRNRVSQIDYLLASRALAGRIDHQIENYQRFPHIERAGLGFREINTNGEVLPSKSNLIHFGDDEVTPTPSNFTPSSKIDFRFPRYESILDNWRNNISDHCPIKVWF